MEGIGSKKFLLNLINGNESNSLPELTGPVIKNLKSAIKLGIEYYDDHPVDQDILEGRKNLVIEIEKYHKKTNIYSSDIKAQIKNLENPKTLIVEVAHQPNIFPYFGIFKK